MDFRSPLWGPQGAERAAGPDLGGGDGGQDCFPDGGGVCGGQEQKLSFSFYFRICHKIFLYSSGDYLCLTDDFFFRLRLLINIVKYLELVFMIQNSKLILARAFDAFPFVEF